VKRVRNEEGGFDLEWIWAPEPGRNGTRAKALLAWAVFKDYCAVDSARGFLHWLGTHWQVLEGKPEECLGRPFLDWCDGMGWKQTGLGAVPKQVVEELRISRAWDPPHLMAFTNGTLNTRTNIFTAGHRKEDHITLCLPFPYEPFAACPRWHAFISEALGGDQGLIELLRSVIRWTLEPKDRDQPFTIEVAIDVFGPAGRGKGVLFEALVGLLGGLGQGVARLDAASVGKPTALHQLLGKRLAVDSDASGHIENAGIFNAIVSNEPVTVKKLYVNEATLRLGVVMWRFFNDAITVSGGGVEGMGRRILTFIFDNPPRVPDRKLKERLRGELPGIFAWAWGMGIATAEHNIGNAAQNKAIADAAVDAAFKRNPKYQFLSEHFPEGKTIEMSILFSMWQEYAAKNGHRSGSVQTFAAEILKITGKPRRVGQRKVTTYDIPTMDHFDWVAHLRLPGAERTGGGVRGTEGGHPPAAGIQRVDETSEASCPIDDHADAQAVSSQNLCPDSVLSLMDVDSSLEKKGEVKKEVEGQKTAQTTVGEGESYAGLKSASPLSTPDPSTQKTARAVAAASLGEAAGRPLQTVSEQVEAVLTHHRFAPSHPQAASTCHKALAAQGISRNQINLAITQLAQQDADDDDPQGELL
jgi:putative DNA primase/helicase